MQVRVKIFPLEVRSKSGPALQYIIKTETSNTSRLPQMVSPSFSTFCSQAKSYRKKMKQNIRLCILLIAVQNWNLCNPTDLPKMEMPWRTERKIFWYYLLVHSRENRLTAFHPRLRCQVPTWPFLCSCVYPLQSLSLNSSTFYKLNNDSHPLISSSKLVTLFIILQSCWDFWFPFRLFFLLFSF